MRQTVATLIVATLLLAGGCASVPSSETLRDLPVLRYGDPVPSGRDYILFFPPDTPIFLVTSVKGTIFAKEAEQQLSVTLRRGIYTYKNWVSYDRVNWRVGQDVIKGEVEIKIPGYDHPGPGWVKIRMDERG